MPPTTLPPIAPVAPLRPADLRREYVAGGSLGWYAQAARALPFAIDDISQDFGDDIYSRMLHDAQIAATLAIFKASILEDGVLLAPAVDDPLNAEQPLAQQLADEATAMLDRLELPMDDVLWDLLDAVAFGSMVAELKWALQPGLDGQTRLQLVALKPKPRRAVSFVVDAFQNLLGLLAVIPGQSTYLPGGVNIVNPQDTPNLLPREKFAIVSWRPRHGDPRGTSLLRPAYDAWWRKRQILPEYLKYLTQFAGASVIGITAPDAQAIADIDVDGNPTGAALISPEQVMVDALVALHNGTAAAFPYGSSVVPLPPQGDGAPFVNAIDGCNIEITKAILTQQLATEEGQHQARAAAEVHQDVLDTLVRQGKRSLVRVLQRDVLERYVRYNWGEAAVHLTPHVSLGSTEQRQLPALMTAVATLVSAGFFQPDQYANLDGLLALPVRDGDGVTAPAATPPPALVAPPVTDPTLPPSDIPTDTAVAA